MLLAPFHIVVMISIVLVVLVVVVDLAADIIEIHLLLFNLSVFLLPFCYVSGRFLYIAAVVLTLLLLLGLPLSLLLLVVVLLPSNDLLPR